MTDFNTGKNNIFVSFLSDIESAISDLDGAIEKNTINSIIYPTKYETLDELKSVINDKNAEELVQQKSYRVRLFHGIVVWKEDNCEINKRCFWDERVKSCTDFETHEECSRFDDFLQRKRLANEKVDLIQEIHNLNKTRGSEEYPYVIILSNQDMQNGVYDGCCFSDGISRKKTETKWSPSLLKKTTVYKEDIDSMGIKELNLVLQRFKITRGSIEKPTRKPKKLIVKSKKNEEKKKLKAEISRKIFRLIEDQEDWIQDNLKDKIAITDSTPLQKLKNILSKLPGDIQKIREKEEKKRLKEKEKQEKEAEKRRKVEAKRKIKEQKEAEKEAEKRRKLEAKRRKLEAEKEAKKRKREEKQKMAKKLKKQKVAERRRQNLGRQNLVRQGGLGRPFGFARFGSQASSVDHIVITQEIDTSHLNFNIHDESFDSTNKKEIKIRIQKRWQAYSHSLKEDDKNTFITEMKKLIARKDVDNLKKYVFHSFPSDKKGQIISMEHVKRIEIFFL